MVWAAVPALVLVAVVVAALVGPMEQEPLAALTLLGVVAVLVALAVFTAAEAAVAAVTTLDQRAVLAASVSKASWSLSICRTRRP